MPEHFLRHILWWVFNCDFWLVFFLLFGILLLWTRWWKTGRVLLFFSGVVVFVACLSPIPDFLGTYLENRFQRIDKLPDDITGVIVIGFGIDRRVSLERGVVTFNCAAQREITLVELYKKYPTKKFIYSAGGFNKDSEKTLVSLMKSLFYDLTLSKPANVIYEDQAIDTLDNALYSLELVKPKPEEKWVLVTSAMNMPRAMGTFKKAGWENLIPYPVDYRTIGRYDLTLNLSLYHGFRMCMLVTYEFVGLIYYYLLGYIDEIIPSPEPQKNEI